MKPGERVDTVDDVLKPGDEIDVTVVEVDKERGRIGLRLSEDPSVEGKRAEELADGRHRRPRPARRRRPRGGGRDGGRGGRDGGAAAATAAASAAADR